ncbi:DMT family transporter [Curtobacterium sp. ISL-83]|uniref:DMT family transporter n=1 Tax=Curtobacterium sp. ISL-83 TaxID=2819145 RepID=UPI001BE98723|nr:DMT family transporter [Curtobacterium sp. ISL-83]MBT2501533.1 DMT family transporter [Curtobacterium sp. ISL-83]
MNALVYVLLALVWGSSFLFIKVGLDGLSAQQVATVRTVLGALTLIAFLLASRRRWPRSIRLWGHLLVVAVFLNAVPASLVAWAEQTVPSGLASIYNATTPITTMIALPLLLPAERLRGRQLGGVVLGIVGVVVLVGPWGLIGDPAVLATVPGQIALLGMTACYGFGLAYLRRFLAGSGLDAPTLAAVQLTLAAVLLLLVAPFTAAQPVHLTGGIIAAMVVLGCLGTGFAYVWNTRLLQAWGAARASTVTYLTPVVGVVLGVLVLGERVRWNEPVGGVVILVGIALASGLLSPDRRHPQVVLPERSGTGVVEPAPRGLGRHDL